MPSATRQGTHESQAVREELRGAICDLTDILLSTGQHRYVLLDGIRHVHALADLAGVGEGVLRTLLRNLQRDLAEHPAEVERRVVAHQLTVVADRL